MEDDSQLVSQLGGFALDNFLSEFTGDSSIRTSGLRALTGGSRSSGSGGAGAAGFDASQIYNDRFADDDEDGDADGLGDDEDDLEAEVDREINAEKSNGRPPVLPLLPAVLPRTKMRGEDDDFDEDEDEDGQDAAQQGANISANTFSGMFLPQAGVGAGFPPLPMQIKQEEPIMDMDIAMQHQGQQQDETEDAAEIAAQQALFQQSYARMQVAQQQVQPEDGFGGYIRQPSPPVMDVATLYPSFAPDKVLNFTELFVPRPRKRARIDPTTELRESETGSAVLTCPI